MIDTEDPSLPLGMTGALFGDRKLFGDPVRCSVLGS